MNRFQKILLLLVLGGVFVLVYWPHVFYPYPFHVDEWHHITEAMRLHSHGAYFQFLQPELARRFSGLEMGFHIWLFLISKVFNLVLAYKFFPAIWAVISAGVLFFVSYRKSNRNFFIAILAVLFFASIKSDSNLTGIWFYTPLSFSIPFIYLYLYFFSEGIEKQSRRKILISFAIMIFLLPFHPLSVLFSLPALAIYSLLNYKYVVKEWKIFSIIFVMVLAGLIFFASILRLDFSQILPQLLSSLRFKHGWGVFELDNSFMGPYNWLAWFFAVFGVICVILKKEWKKYLFHILLPFTLLVSVLCYKIWGVSYFSPFQRNLYYLAISLPLLSALGLDFVLVNVKKMISALTSKNEKASKDSHGLYSQIIINFFLILIFVVSFGIIFSGYYNLPKGIRLYQVIDRNDYDALVYMSRFAPATVMSPINIGTALFSLSGHEPVAAIAYYGNRGVLEEFIDAKNCDQKSKVLVSHGIAYVFWQTRIDCPYATLVKQIGHDYIYKVNLP